MEEITISIAEYTKELDKLQQQQADDAKGFSKQQKTTERYLAKRQMLSARKEECTRNIRDLGVLPEEAFEKYTKEKIDRVSDFTANVSSNR